jgi:hypothetical protein
LERENGIRGLVKLSDMLDIRDKDISIVRCKNLEWFSIGLENMLGRCKVG